MSKGRLRLIEAATRVIVRDGVTCVTMEAVAGEAGLSKGGFLYHFPTKDKLLSALVEHQADQWRDSYRDAYERAREGPGRMARAILDGHLLDPTYWTEPAKNVFAATIAALAHDRKLIQPLREVYSEVRERLATDGLRPGVSELISAAVDGVWLNWGLGVGASDEEYLSRVHSVLEDLLAKAVEEARHRVDRPRDAEKATKGKTS